MDISCRKIQNFADALLRIYTEVKSRQNFAYLARGIHMRNALALLAVLSLSALAGCSFKEGNPHHNPGQNPSCFADAPFYYEPSSDIAPKEIIKPNVLGLEKKGIPVRYISDSAFFIKHPLASKTENELPRMKYYVSTNSGRHWAKGGAFGKGAEYSQYGVEHDAAYWVRFVGIGIKPTKNIPTSPHRIYVIDTKAPKIKVKVLPGPWLDKKKTIPRIYRVGDVVRVSWSVQDVNIDPKSVKLSACFGRFPNNIEWERIGKNTATVGSAEVRLSPEAVKGGVVFRVDAIDKAGNIGYALSRTVRVQPRTRKFVYTKRTKNTGVDISEKKYKRSAIGNVDNKQYVTSERKKRNNQNPMTDRDPGKKLLNPINLKSKKPQADMSDAEELLGAAEEENTDSSTKPDYSVTETKENRRPRKTNPSQTDMDEKISESLLSDLIINGDKKPKKHGKNPDLIPVKNNKDRASVKDFDIEEPKNPAPKTEKNQAKHEKGWPTAGLSLQGGMGRCLNWLPTDAKNYKRVSLQFSSDGGKTWKTVNKKLRAGQANLWYVPAVNSTKCKVQIIGIDHKGGISVLHTSQKFTVNTKDWDDFDFDDLK